MRTIALLLLVGGCATVVPPPPAPTPAPDPYRAELAARLAALNAPRPWQPAPDPPPRQGPKITYHMTSERCDDPRLAVVLEQCVSRGDGHTQHRTFTCPTTLPMRTRDYAWNEAGYVVADCGLESSIKHHAENCPTSTHQGWDAYSPGAAQDIVVEECR